MAKPITLLAFLLLFLPALHAAAATEVCSAGFASILNGPILEICAIASVASIMLIVFGYFLGQVTSNPKVSVWAKSEILQVLMSVGSTILLLFLVNSFCAINMGEVASIFGITAGPAYSGSVYSAAEAYLSNTLSYSHDALRVIRYHLEAYTVLSQVSSFVCDLKSPSMSVFGMFTVPAIGWGCFFSYSGQNGQPLGAYSAVMGALNLFFNSTLVAYVTTLNFLFILMFIYKGFVLFLLPFAIFMRSLPYMRSFGSLLIAVALSFMIIYPLTLAVFGMMADVLLREPPNIAPFLNENKFPDNGGISGSAKASAGALNPLTPNGGATYFEHIYFPDGVDNAAGAIAFAAYAFIAGVFLPTAALLAAMASVSYLARIYGEEIDLSRILQMV
jgi:hypothetical protein